MLPLSRADFTVLLLSAGVARKLVGSGETEEETLAPLLSHFSFASCGADPMAAQALLALASCGSSPVLAPVPRYLGCHGHPRDPSFGNL